MKKKRYSIQDIAEVLVDKLDSMELVAERIEKVAEKPLKVDLKAQKELLNEYEVLFNSRKKGENQILADLRDLQSKNKGRLPNWVLAVLFSFFLGLIGSIYFSYSSIKKVELLEQEKTYYKSKYLELKK